MAPQIKGFFGKIKKDYPGELRDLKFYAKINKVGKCNSEERVLVKVQKEYDFSCTHHSEYKGFV